MQTRYAACTKDVTQGPASYVGSLQRGAATGCEHVVVRCKREVEHLEHPEEMEL